jgi:hypothetical protein
MSFMCTFSFSFVSIFLRSHKDFKHCKICDVFIPKGWENIENHKAEKHVHDLHFKCYRCGRQYKSKLGLKSHFIVNHADKVVRFKCQICNAQYGTQAMLTRHKHVHDKIWTTESADIIIMYVFHVYFQFLLCVYFLKTNKTWIFKFMYMFMSCQHCLVNFVLKNMTITIVITITWDHTKTSSIVKYVMFLFQKDGKT